LIHYLTSRENYVQYQSGSKINLNSMYSSMIKEKTVDP
jgi:hypothetical protein